MTDEMRAIGDALLTLRHARVRAFELRPGDQIFMRRHEVDEATLCQNDSGYEVVEVLDVRTIHPRGRDETVEVTTRTLHSSMIATDAKFLCSPLFSGMFRLGQDERV